MPVLPYIIKGGLHAYAFFSKFFTVMPTPNSDAFAALLSPTLRNDIGSFVNSLHHFAKFDQNYRSRLLVTAIGIEKASLPAQHESLSVWVRDTDTVERHEFVVERTPSGQLDNDGRFSAFSLYKNSTSVVEKIQDALNNRHTVIMTQGEPDTETDSESETIPLLPLTDVIPRLPPTETSSTSPLSMIDVVTTTIARTFAAARMSSRSISPQILAEDSISGRAPGTLKPENCICRFEPVQLYLFDLALLVLVVHEYAPIYGLFQNQCYMFASVTFDAIVQRYSLPPNAYEPHPQPPSTSSTAVPAPIEGPNPLPRNSNVITLPVSAGRWSGLLIVDPIVKQEIVTIVLSAFMESKINYKISTA